MTLCHGLKLEAPDGKKRVTDCANTAGIFRIIQSIPSPKAEPFKRWLAQVGYERVQTAINRTVETIAKNESGNRHLLVMATGTGKTYTAFQIIYRL